MVLNGDWKALVQSWWKEYKVRFLVPEEWTMTHLVDDLDLESPEPEGEDPLAGIHLDEEGGKPDWGRDLFREDTVVYTSTDEALLVGGEQAKSGTGPEVVVHTVHEQQ